MRKNKSHNNVDHSTAEPPPKGKGGWGSASEEMLNTRASDNKLTRSLTFRYVAVLLLLAGLAVFNDALLKQAISIKGSDSSSVNISGRQRMLSQRVMLLTSHLIHINASADPHQSRELEAFRNKLEQAIKLMEGAHLYLSGTSEEHHNTMSKEIRSLYFGPRALVDQEVRAFLKRAKSFLVFYENGQSAPGDTPQMDVDASDLLLNSLDAIVTQYEKESELRVENFRLIQDYILGINLLVLMLSALVVFRPLVEKIQQYIREQRRAEKELRHQTSIQRMLHAITSVANQYTDLNAAFRYCLAEVCSFSGWPVGHVFIVDDENPNQLVSTDIWHITDPERFAEFRNVTNKIIFTLGMGLPGQVLATQRPGWIVDLLSHKNFPRREVSKNVGLRSGFAFPVIVDARTEAVLEFYTPEIIDPDPILLQALEDAGVQIGRMLERNKAGVELKESNARYRSIANSASTAMIITSGENGTIVSWNPAAEKMFGYEEKEIIGSPLTQIMPKRFREAHLKNYKRAFQAEGKEIEGRRLELVGLRKDGGEFPMELSLGMWNSRGRTYFSGVIYDITLRKKTEQTLQNSQKMDAVGKLAGGIAHDFNNILGIVMGNLEILRRLVSSDPKALGRVDTALKGTRRGARLTKRLLGFSSQESGEREIASVNGVIVDLKELIRRSLTEKIKVEFRLTKDVWSVEVDPGDLGDSIINLAINARDAMPDGGHLIIATANKDLDEQYAQLNPDFTPGEYVMVSVSDTGTGMTSKTIDRIFDPFFSTKEKDKGTGLGLAMVYGFVKRSAGHISVKSELGHGSEFRIFLPRSLQKRNQVKATDDMAKALPRGGETILVVDDEKTMTEVAVNHLTELGYQTITAANGRQALKILSGRRKIDLLFTDVIMPGGIDGFQLARKARREHPKLGILLTSGFVEMDEKSESQNDPLIAKFKADLLSKPYNKRELAENVRRVLDECG